MHLVQALLRRVEQSEVKHGKATRCLALALVGALTLVAPHAATAAPKQVKKAVAQKKSAPTKTRTSLTKPAAADTAGRAEARLIDIYKLIGAQRSNEALSRAQALVQDYPHFQLAQLVLGDLLTARTRPLHALGDVKVSSEQEVTLNDLRLESARRVAALRTVPEPGTAPAPFVALSAQARHAIAVDASKSRLYLFENGADGLRLLAHYYISVGKAGTAKVVEGDQKTPLGVYYITSSLDPKSLKDFYGAGALPISYPNVLDNKRGKTGSGIWLHGTPPQQFSRAPQASDGCVVLANPDLEHILRTVSVRTTPVVIASQLNWVPTQKARADAKDFEEALQAWRDAKSDGKLDKLLRFYTRDFSANGKDLSQWSLQLRSEVQRLQGRELEIKDLSMLRWTDTADTMVVTFGEVARGTRTGNTKRQYWVREGKQWKIFFEGAV